MTIGESIRSKRIERGLNQTQLAGAIGCSAPQVSWWETDKVFPHILTCISLADFFEITLDELVGRDNIKSH